jgi:hypothetical protein
MRSEWGSRLLATPVHDWPLNVFGEEDAAAQLSILGAIASSDLHNLVYRATIDRPGGDDKFLAHDG